MLVSPKRNEALPFVPTWIELEVIMQSEILHTHTDCMILNMYNWKKVVIREAKGRTWVPRGPQECRGEEDNSWSMNTKLQIQEQGFLCSCVVCLRLITEMHCIFQKARREYFEDFYYKKMFEEITKFTLIFSIAQCITIFHIIFNDMHSFMYPQTLFRRIWERCLRG